MVSSFPSVFFFWLKCCQFCISCPSHNATCLVYFTVLCLITLVNLVKATNYSHCIQLNCFFLFHCSFLHLSNTKSSSCLVHLLQHHWYVSIAFVIAFIWLIYWRHLMLNTQSDWFADFFTGRFGCRSDRGNPCEPFWSSESVTASQSCSFKGGSQHMDSHEADCVHSGMSKHKKNVSLNWCFLTIEVC